MPEKQIIACELVKVLPIPHAPSMIKQCSQCGKDVWLSRSTALSAPSQAVITCMPCAIGMMDKDTVIEPPTAAQVEEMKTIFKRKNG